MPAGSLVGERLCGLVRKGSQVTHRGDVLGGYPLQAQVIVLRILEKRWKSKRFTLKSSIIPAHYLRSQHFDCKFPVPTNRKTWRSQPPRLSAY